MVYGVTFGEFHSFRNWKLLLNERPKISPPAPKTIYIDIPGGDGHLDLTESLSGNVNYNTRTIEFVFITKAARKNWPLLYSEILDCVHGKEMKIILDEDPEYYYIGRVFVNEWKSSEKYSTIVINAEVDPYKYDIYSSLEDWLWDPFDFETGIIREYDQLKVDGELSVTVVGNRKKVIPTFIVYSDDGAMQVTFKGDTYDLSDGKTIVLNIVIEEGDNELVFSGNGTVSIDYRGARL